MRWVARASLAAGSRETAPEVALITPSMPLNVKARFNVEVRKAPSLPEAKKEDRRCEQTACDGSLLAAFAAELGANCGFEVMEGGDVPASHECLTARNVSGDGCVAS